MRAKAVFVRRGDVLVPAHDEGRAIISRLKEGERVLLHVDRVRYPDHHRLAFAVFQELADAMGMPVDKVVLWLKWETGLVDVVLLPNKKVIAEARSISWEAMGQDEFQEWWNEALTVIKEKMLPEVDRRHFEKIRDIIVGEDRRVEKVRRRA